MAGCLSPMRLTSNIKHQSFSEKGASPRLAQLLDAETRAEEAINRLQNVAKGAWEGGLEMLEWRAFVFDSLCRCG